MRALDPRRIAILATAFAPLVASAQASDDWNSSKWGDVVAAW